MGRKILTRADVRTMAKNGYQVTGWVHCKGRLRVDLITPAGAPRTREVKDDPR